MKNATVDKKFIVQLQGKDFVTYEGLLDTAHQLGLLSIETELVKYEENQAIFRAIAKTEDKTFTGYGDADYQNVNKMISKHLIRMAETRAKARALRDLTNIGMTAVEELGGDDVNGQKPTPQNSKLTEAQSKKIYALSKNLNMSPEQAKEIITKKYGVQHSKELSKGQASEFIEYLGTLKGGDK